MFEQELNDLRTRIKKLGKRGLHLNPVATQEQIEDYEKTLGLALPEQYREFISHVGDGFRISKNLEQRLWMFPLFPRNNTDYAIGVKVLAELVIFPFEEYQVEIETRIRNWEELTQHERMEKQVGLGIGLGGRRAAYSVIVLTGEEQGKVWTHSGWGGLRDPCDMSFFDALGWAIDNEE